jgi:hypothetical protein
MNKTCAHLRGVILTQRDWAAVPPAVGHCAVISTSPSCGIPGDRDRDHSGGGAGTARRLIGRLNLKSAGRWGPRPCYDVLCAATALLLYGTPEEWQQFQLGPEGSASRTSRGSPAKKERR